MPQPPLASYMAAASFSDKAFITNGPQTESAAFCGSLLQQLPAVGCDGAVCVIGARIWPQALRAETSE